MSQPRLSNLLIPALGVFFDAVAIEAAFFASYFIRFNTTFLTFLPLHEEVPPLSAYLYSSLVVIPAWLLLFQYKKMYGARRNVALSDEFFNVVKIVTLGMLIVMSAAFFYRAFSYSRVVFVLLWATSIVFIFLGRICLYEIEKFLYSKGQGLRNAIIIGNNKIAQKVYRTLHLHPLLGYKLIGYIADSINDGFQALYLGTPEDAPKIIADYQVEFAIISLTYEDYPKIYKLVHDCDGMNVEFLMVPDVVEIMAAPSAGRMIEIEGIPLWKLKGFPMTTWGMIWKRTFDVVVSFLLLVVTLPLFVIIPIFIKVTSKGTVFYSQERVSIDGKRFKMIKFRTMKQDAEVITGPVWAKEDDPRVTTIGRYLRKMSLDELPQFINVLKGEMSLVGPRPERPVFVEKFKDFVPKYLDRHRVKTGMTGWAQVNGLRGDSSLEERIKYDIYYIENWSFWFDIKILLKTLKAMFQSVR